MEEPTHLQLLAIMIAFVAIPLAGLGWYVAKTNAKFDVLMTQFDTLLQTDHVRRSEFVGLRDKVEMIGERQGTVLARLDDARAQLAAVTVEVNNMRVQLARHERGEAAMRELKE